MAAADIILLVFWSFFAILILAIVIRALMKAYGKEPARSLYQSQYQSRRSVIVSPIQQTPFGSGEQTEVDIRLPYKRFKELYPYSRMTYQEYKKLQMERAFKRAVSSQRNKRMVR